MPLPQPPGSDRGRITGEEKDMDQKLRKLLRPSRGIYIFVLVGFCAAALVTEQYILAGVEAAVTLLIIVGHTLSRNFRDLSVV